MLDAAGWAQWQHLAQTVLPGYVAQTAWLVLGVGLGTLLVGGGAATLVSLFEFRGRRWLDALLLLPMAMPAYVAAYAYTDALQFAGPLQSGLRQWFGWQGALWGDVRSLPGAVLLFTLCLYPYVYLLVRTALAERAAAMLEAAQMLGAPLHRRVLQVALPMARPALAAGLMLVLMETLADYGVGSYFGLNTLSTGVYKAWLVHDDRWAAAQIASLFEAVRWAPSCFNEQPWRIVYATPGDADHALGDGLPPRRRRARAGGRHVGRRRRRARVVTARHQDRGEQRAVHASR